MRAHAVVGIAVVAVASGAAFGAPSVIVEGTEAPTALWASNDTPGAMPDCRVEWTLIYADGSHYTEAAIVDLPAEGSVQVSDCREWWDERRSASLTVVTELFDAGGARLSGSAYGPFRSVPRRGLPVDGWTAKSSRGAGEDLAFDGNPQTRWDTGAKQRSGDWYLLDLGRTQQVSGVILDARGSAEDYPGGLRVEGSTDGKTWQSLAEIADVPAINRGGLVRVEFDPTPIRAVQLTLTAPHGDSWFWSIHELSVLSPDAPEASAPAGAAEEPVVAKAAPAVAPEKSVLYFSCTRGFRHSAAPYMKPILTRLGEENGFSVLCSEDPRMISKERLAGLDCVIFGNTTGSFLDDSQKVALLDFVSAGGAFVGIHAATDTHYDWPSYRDLVGGWFDGHPWNEDVKLLVEVPDHPACEPVPQGWVVADEIYQQRDWSRDDVCVLMSLDPSGTDMTKPGIHRKDGDFGIAWCKRYGKGRSFYTALGHREEVCDSPVYQAHLLGGMRWAMGQAEGTSTPHPRPE
mgnify:CR=1 FL=1